MLEDDIICASEFAAFYIDDDIDMNRMSASNPTFFESFILIHT